MVTEEELLEYCLFLLQGIPSQGVFELDQESFTFSINQNRRVYITASEQGRNDYIYSDLSGSHQGVKLKLNEQMFRPFMEAGTFFLHL